MIKKITPDELRRMSSSEGLILQGCGGDLDEWVTGINELFTKENILLDGDTFQNVSVFEHDGHTNLLFNMDDIRLDVGKLAMWRLQTHGQFGGYWLSDYVPNRLGGFVHGQPQEREKPDCPLIGQDGNIFNLMGIASRTLKDNGQKTEAAKMRQRVMESGSYDIALCIIGEYVNITSVDEDENEEFDEQEDYYEDEEYGGMDLQ